jgi:outer membrane protein assembly factor BamE (lipoprotein component of BamABCDE complex)
MCLPKLTIKRAMLAVALLALALSPVRCVLRGAPLDQRLQALLLLHDTVHARDFSESAFRRVHAGLTHTEVVALLGTPFHTNRVTHVASEF